MFVDEAGVEGMVLIVLLGVLLFAAFSVSGYFIVRVSGICSVFESVWAVGAVIIVVVVLFSVIESIVLVIVLGMVFVAFVLVCAGVWFGFER